jgi:hypothetical protein
MKRLDQPQGRPTSDYLLMVIRIQGEQLAELATIATRISDEVITNKRHIASLEALVETLRQRPN